MAQQVKKHAEKIRFVVVGGANTAIDFALLFIMTGLGVDKIVANYFSTTAAFLFSFVANKNYTFRATSGKAGREFVLFTVITLAGLWILQPIAIFASEIALADIISDQQLLLLVSKVIATVLTLVWNYIFYSRIVFKQT